MSSEAPDKPEQPANSNVASGIPDEAAPNAVSTSAEARLPTRKDISLREFLNKMDDYAPIVR